MSTTRLTPLSRILIVIAILAGLFFLFRKYIPEAGKESSQTITTEQIVEEKKQTTTTEAKTVDRAVKTFDYTPPLPVNGKLKGVVELGAAGFNSFIVEVDRSKNWQLKKADYGNSLVIDGLASGQDITTGLKAYIAQILDYGVSGKDIHFVVSSGAQKVEVTQQIINGLKSLRYVVNTVTPEEEGSYALQAALPEVYRERAFVVDIGSGNTKVSWIQDGSIKAMETYGSKYYANNTPDNQVYDSAKSIGLQVPRDKREVCFMIGGVPFNLAKDIRQGEERYTVLKLPDAYTGIEEAKTKSGLNIYEGIKDGSNCDVYVFDWDANFTIGFLLSLPY